MDDRIGRQFPALFWDLDQALVEVNQNGHWLVARVLQRGTWEDWLVIREIYGESSLKQLMPSLHLDPRSANFLNLYCSL